jgi:D-alanine--poly(phosphoribitol) ligase subunit 2
MELSREVAQIVDEVLREHNQTAAQPITLDRGPDTPLYGPDGGLDSLALVTVVLAVEQALEERLGVRVTLANEKAMSMRHSPFATVGRLVEYATELASGHVAEPA